MNRTDCATQEDVLTIDGMFCSACAAGVEAVLRKLPGVRRAAVSFAADAAIVEWQDQARDPAALIDAITRLGYQPRLLDNEQQSPQRAKDPAYGLQLRLAVALFFGMWMMLPTLGLYLHVSNDEAVNLGLATAAGIAALPVLLYSGYPFYRMGLLTLRGGVPGVDAMISIGVLTSVGLSLALLYAGHSEVYFEVAVSLITLQLIARLVDVRVRRRAQDVVLKLQELSPSTVAMLDDEGQVSSVALNAVKIGDTVLVRAGQRVAVDGDVAHGTATADRSLLTGETAARPLEVGDTVQAGERLLDGHLLLRVTAAAGKRRLDELAYLVRSTLATRPPWQKKIDRVARSFLWIAGATAALGALLVLLAGGGMAAAAERALAVFVIACPCALSLATPLAGMVAAAAAARQRFALRDLAAVTGAEAPTHVFLDKTGTLTSGRPEVVQVHSFSADLKQEAVLRLAAQAEHGAEHPLAQAIVEAAGGTATSGSLEDARITVAPGCGVTHTQRGVRLRVGSASWLTGLGYTLPVLEVTSATRVWIARNDFTVGAIDLRDTLRPGVQEAIAALQKRGMRLRILSGDQPAPVLAMAEALGIPGSAAQTPEKKAEIVATARAEGAVIAFVGDGLNDGPALAAADLGIAVAGATDVASNASVVNLLDGGAERLPEVLDLLDVARRTARQNLCLALAYNALAIPFALCGFIDPVFAAIAMAASSLTVVANSASIYRRRTSVGC